MKIKYLSSLILIALCTTSNYALAEQATSTEQQIAAEDETNAVERIEVRSKTSELPTKASPVSVMTSVEIERKQSTNFTDLLRGEIPGVFVSNSGVYDWTTQVSSRGDVFWNPTYSDLNFNYMKVLIDGVEVVRPTLLSTLDPSNIERIEVLRGPQASALFGSEGASGVMQIFTKKGTPTFKPEIVLKASAGTIASDYKFDDVDPKVQDHSLNISGGNNALSYRAGASYVTLGGWTPDYDSKTESYSFGLRGEDGPFSADFSVFHTNRKSTLSSYFYECTFEDYEDEWGICVRNRRVQPRYKMAETLAALTLKYDTTENWNHTLTLGRDNNQFRTTTYQRDTLRYVTNYFTTITPGITAQYTAGFDTVAYSVAEEGHNHDHGPGQSHPASDDWKNTGYYGVAELAYHDTWYLTLAARMEDGMRNVGKSHNKPLQPSVGLSYVALQGPTTVKLRTQWGRTARAPMENMLAGSESRSLIYLPTDLKPEKKVGWDAGVDINGRMGSLSVTRFVEEGSGLMMPVILDDTVRPVIRQYQNIGVIGNSGWEIDGRLHWDRYSLSANVTTTDNTIKQLTNAYPEGPNQTYQVGDRVINIPEHSGGVTATMNLGQGFVSLNATWIGPRRQRDVARGVREEMGIEPNPASSGREYYISAPTFWRLHLRGEQDITNNITLFGRVENLLNDQESDRNNSFITPGRTVVLGVRVTI